MCEATKNLGVAFIQDILLLLSYAFGLYLFAGRQHQGSDKLFVIVQSVSASHTRTLH